MNRRLIHAAVPFYGNFPQRQQNEVRDVFQVQPVSQISRIETRQVQDDEVDRNEAGKLPDAKALLVNSVLDGHCSEGPESVLRIEVTLRDLFEPKRRDYEGQLRGYRSFVAEKTAREFSASDSPTTKARCSINLSLQKYFLDKSGQLDNSKTPDPLPLPGFAYRSQIHAAAERVPGLETCSGGNRDEDRVVVIGWDRSAVWRVAEEIGKQQNLRREAVEENGWDRLMQKHRELAQKTAASATPKKTFSIESSNELRLRITNGQKEGWVGILDFGVLEGIMLLDESKEGLASRVAGLREDSMTRQDSSGESDSQEEDNNDRRTTGKKRKKAAARSSRPGKAQKRMKDAGGTIYFQWRGVETGEGEIQLDGGNRNVGQLEFQDSSSLSFKGIASLGFVGADVQFEGFKIGSLGGQATRSWKDYSVDAYEKAGVERWK